MRVDKKHIPLTECVARHVYRVRSRNLTVGVFNGDTGFLGLREKFGNVYVFTEYHYDSGAPYGTVSPYEDLGSIDDFARDNYCLRLEEHYPFTYCGWCGDVLKQLPISPGTIPWEHTTITDCQKPYPNSRANSKLFEALERIENKLRLEAAGNTTLETKE